MFIFSANVGFNEFHAADPAKENLVRNLGVLWWTAGGCLDDPDIADVCWAHNADGVHHCAEFIHNWCAIVRANLEQSWSDMPPSPQCRGSSVDHSLLSRIRSRPIDNWCRLLHNLNNVFQFAAQIRTAYNRLLPITTLSLCAFIAHSSNSLIHWAYPAATTTFERRRCIRDFIGCVVTDSSPHR